MDKHGGREAQKSVQQSDFAMPPELRVLLRVDEFYWLKLVPLAVLGSANINYKYVYIQFKFFVCVFRVQDKVVF